MYRNFGCMIQDSFTINLELIAYVTGSSRCIVTSSINGLVKVSVSTEILRLRPAARLT